MKNVNRKNHRGESGTSLILGTVSLIFLVPMVGLAVDTGFLYSAKSKMQASVDGAALAAARSLNLGSTLQSQQATAAQNALNWFYANFPASTWNSTGTNMSIAGETNSASGFGVSGSPAVCGAVSVCIFPDASNPQLDHVNVNASTNIPTWFMRWFGYTTLNIAATGNATRRAVVVMMVLDRSYSMCMVSGSYVASPSCSKSNPTSPCAQMITAAKQFTGQFAQGRDYVGLISFAENSYITQAPSTTFQSTLGYTNSSGSAVGSAAGSLDNLICEGGTGTAQAVSMAYQLLYQTGLPGALNIIMLETDGLPNTLTMNFYDSVNAVTALNNSSNCTDTAGKKVSQAGSFVTTPTNTIPAWTSGLALNASPFLTTSGYYSNIPAGMIASVSSQDPSLSNDFFVMFPYFTTSTANNYQTNIYLSTTGTAPNGPNATNGCAFDGGYVGTNPSDLKWWPAKDVYGNQLNPSNAYKTVTTDAQGHITQGGSSPTNWTNYHNGVLNATDNSAYVARSNTTNPVYVFAIGLGGNSVTGPPDPILLQRMANDPHGDLYNSTPYYSACASETGCITYAGQYQGTFIYAPTSAELNSAFLTLSSQILRLNQ